MEHDELDEKFRDLIHNDKSELNEQEINSKEAIWEELNLPQKERKIFPSILLGDSFWKIAAAVLLLLLGGTSWFFTNKINQQNQHFAKLEKELLETENSLQTVQLEFAQLESKDENDNNAISRINQPKEIVEVLKKEYVENVVYVRDTVFLEKNILPKENIRVVRDTVFIEVPAKQPTRLVDFEKEKETLKEKILKKKKKKSKMEFVFGKKPLEKPAKKNPLNILKDSEVAKKSIKEEKRNVISIPINNN